MDWAKVWPVIVSTPGGVVMAIAIWALVTNRIALPREVQTWKGLYEEGKKDNVRLSGMVENLTNDLREQNQNHEKTLDLVKSLVPGSRQRRYDDPAPG